ATTSKPAGRGHGNRGKVFLWSDSETTFAATILARGGAKSGDGGFVEVSRHRLLNYSGMTDTRAPKGATGTLLLDPENYYINANGSPPLTDPTASAISASTLAAELDSNNVVLSTSPSGTNAGDIFVQNSFRRTSDYSLTLNANRHIAIGTAVTISNSGAGNLVLRADSAGTGTGTVTFASG